MSTARAQPVPPTAEQPEKPRRGQPAVPPPNIYVIGAQCTGKTTLVTALQAHFSTTSPSNPSSSSSSSSPDDDDQSRPRPPPPVVIREVARGVLARHNFATAEIRDAPARSLELQRLILRAQARAEAAALRGGEEEGEEAGLGVDGDAGRGGAAADDDDARRWFISDRSGLDPIVYAARHVSAAAALELEALAEWADVLRPRMSSAGALVVVCEPGRRAWMVDDGVRLMPRDAAEWRAFHADFCAALARLRIPHHVLPCDVADIGQRVAWVVRRWEALARGDEVVAGGGHR